MNSSLLFGAGLGSLVGGFAFPALSLSLQAAAFGLFVASEVAYRYEQKFVLPVQSRRYQAWQSILDHAYEHQTGAAQAHATNQIDWRYRQRGQQLNLTGSVREQYLNLFTQGRPTPTQQTVDVAATSLSHTQRSEQPAPPSRPERPSAPPQPAAPTAQGQQAAAESAEAAPLMNLSKLIKTPFVLIWGAQGGGKTSLMKLLAQARQAAGHRITVADPHGSAAEWGDWQVVGSGRNFAALNSLLKAYDDDITADYQRYAAGERDFAYSTLLIDEFTQWGSNCDSSAQFVKSVCSDIRKINRCVVIVSHSRTLAGLGGATGFAEAIRCTAVTIELEAELGEDGEYQPTGYGWLQYPTKPKVKVQIPYVHA